MAKASMGGWCAVRDCCEHYSGGSDAERMNPSENLCRDLEEDDDPIVRVIRPRGTWERGAHPLFRRATWIDAVA